MKALTYGPQIIHVRLEPGDPPIKPCPFCGSDAELVNDWKAQYTIKCVLYSCPVEMVGLHARDLTNENGRKRFIHWPNKGLNVDFQPAAHWAAAKDVIDRWNRRV